MVFVVRAYLLDSHSFCGCMVRNMKIYKYPLGFSERQTVMMPALANIIHINVQRGIIYIWAEVDEFNSDVPRHFRIVGTGHDLPDNVCLKYIGTCHIDNYVWHVYEELK
jgi:hypothetical protein